MLIVAMVITVIVAIIATVILIYCFVKGRRLEAFVSLVLSFLSIGLFFILLFSSIAMTSKKVVNNVFADLASEYQPEITTDADGNYVIAGEPVYSNRGEFSLTLPEGWGNYESGYYGANFSEVKELFDDSMFMVNTYTFSVIMAGTMDLGDTKFDSEEIVVPFSDAIVTDDDGMTTEIYGGEVIYVNGREAYQFNMKITYSIFSMNFLTTVIDGEDSCIFVMVCGFGDNYNDEEFKAITNSTKWE